MACSYLVVGSTLLTNKNIAFSDGKLILLRTMYMNCATIRTVHIKYLTICKNYLPLKSAGTKNFFLSMSGMVDLGTFSTMTYYGRKRDLKDHAFQTNKNLTGILSGYFSLIFLDSLCLSSIREKARKAF